MRTMTPVLAACLCVGAIFPVVAVADQNDASSGGDAPASWPSEIEPAEGVRYEGRLDPQQGDQIDWYSVPVPADHVLELTVLADHWSIFRYARPGGFSEGRAGTTFLDIIPTIEGVAHFGIESWFGLINYVFVYELIPILAQDDAGSGGDAPGTRHGALLVEPGSFSGRVDPHYPDPNDFYVVPGSGFRVSVTTQSDDLIVQMYDEFEDRGSIMGASYGRVFAASGELTLEVSARGAAANYTITLLEMTPPPMDDAGTGRDAPDSGVQAPFLGDGSYRAHVDDGWGDLSDTYRIDARGLRLEVASTQWFSIHDGDNQILADGARAKLLDPGIVRLKFWQPGSYQFDVVLGPIHDDAGSGHDAPGDSAHAMSVGFGSFSGRVNPASSDARDSYTVPGEGFRITVWTDSATLATNLLDQEEDRGSSTGPGTRRAFARSGELILEVFAPEQAADYTITIEAATPPPMDDAGIGRDAPRSPYQAPFLGSGSYDASIDEQWGDYDDAYRIDATGMRLQVSATQMFGIYSADDRILVEGARADLADPGIVFLKFWEPGPYHLDIDLVPPPDLAIANLSVAPRPTATTDWASVPSAGVERDVFVSIVNLGGPHAGGAVACQVTYADGRTQDLGSRTLAAGDGVERLSFRWNGLGAVGDATIRATVTTDDDSNPDNDAAVIQSYVIVGGTGHGTHQDSTPPRWPPGPPSVS